MPKKQKPRKSKTMKLLEGEQLSLIDSHRHPEVGDRVVILAVDYSPFDPRYVGRAGVVSQVRDIDHQYRQVTIRLDRAYLRRKIVTLRTENLGIIAGAATPGSPAPHQLALQT